MSEEKQETKPQLFTGGAGAVAPVSTGAVAATARATQEVQAALVIARNNPRDETRAISKIVTACQRRGLAEVAEYEYTRGGSRIIGPTVDLILAIANRWGNLSYGWEEVERSNGQSKVRCMAWDLENNSKAERTIYVKHWRDTKAGGYEVTDERDIYELLANQAQRRMRSCLEQVIDQDVISMAIDTCRNTLTKGEKTPLRDRAVAMCVAFAEFAVTQVMIEKRLGNKLDAISENQLASLRRVYKGLKDGVGQREDYFAPEALEPKLPETPGQVSTPGPEAPKPAPQPSEAVKQAIKRSRLAPVKPVVVPTAENPLALLRRICADMNIKEGEVLDYLNRSGSTDGSLGSLDELMLLQPDTVKSVIDNWHEVSAVIQGA